MVINQSALVVFLELSQLLTSIPLPPIHLRHSPLPLPPPLPLSALLPGQLDDRRKAVEIVFWVLDVPGSGLKVEVDGFEAGTDEFAFLLSVGQ